ncbi:MAG: hypothetical protein SF187_26820 [Deltaproteobacteria bacterium]|nr:hypothetical protein [Deltaproteobacteria bacterium]
MKFNWMSVIFMCAWMTAATACSKDSSSGSDEAGGDGGGGSGGSASGGKGGGAGMASGGSSSNGGTGGASGGGSSGSEIAIANYPLALATAQCEQMMKCCSINVDKCAAKVSARYTAGLSGLKASVTAGRVNYDGKKLAKCIEDLKAAACDAKAADIDSVRASCIYITGTVANGSECTIGADCKEGFCGTPAGATKMQCAAKLEIDATCKDSGQCKSENCKKATTSDVEGKCAAAAEPKAGLCGILPEAP